MSARTYAFSGGESIALAVALFGAVLFWVGAKLSGGAK